MSLVVAAVITRTELALADLNLNDGANFKVIGIGPGPKVWNRQTVSSPYLHGRALVSAVLDAEVAPLNVRVKGTSDSTLNANLAALCRAFEQFAYHLTLTIGGQVWTWACEPADYSIGPGEEFSKFHMEAHQHEVTLQVPRNPIPLAGSL